jgi:hypothetical protein
MLFATAYEKVEHMIDHHDMEYYCEYCGEYLYEAKDAHVFESDGIPRHARDAPRNIEYIQHCSSYLLQN